VQSDVLSQAHELRALLSSLKKEGLGAEHAARVHGLLAELLLQLKDKLGDAVHRLAAEQLEVERACVKARCAAMHALREDGGGRAAAGGWGPVPAELFLRDVDGMPQEEEMGGSMEVEMVRQEALERLKALQDLQEQQLARLQEMGPPPGQGLQAWPPQQRERFVHLLKVTRPSSFMRRAEVEFPHVSTGLSSFTWPSGWGH
jgi:hypothetical protein